MDLEQARYRTFDDLRVFCYRVASVVGSMMSHVIGFAAESRDEVLARATELGFAMQIANILRDIGEDRDRGRVYLPQEDLDRFGCSEASLRARVRNPAFEALMRLEVARARAFHESARPGIALAFSRRPFRRSHRLRCLLLASSRESKLRATMFSQPPRLRSRHSKILDHRPAPGRPRAGRALDDVVNGRPAFVPRRALRPCAALRLLLFFRLAIAHRSDRRMDHGPHAVALRGASALPRPVPGRSLSPSPELSPRSASRCSSLGVRGGRRRFLSGTSRRARRPRRPPCSSAIRASPVACPSGSRRHSRSRIGLRRRSVCLAALSSLPRCRPALRPWPSKATSATALSPGAPCNRSPSSPSTLLPLASARAWCARPSRRRRRSMA